MASPLITGTDLEDVPGITGTSEQLEYAAGRASRLVMGAWSNPRHLSAAPDWVKDIAVDVAARYLSNPRATTSVTRSVDDGSRTERFDGAGRRFGFYLTDEEEARLEGRPVTQKVGSIRLRVPGWCGR